MTMNTLRSRTFALLAALPLSALAADQNWPQWRGPLANGHAPAANPPIKWSETENVKWKIRLPGSGAGTPIIWGNQIFIQAAVPTGKKVEPATNKTAFLPSLQAVGALQTPADAPPPGDRPRRRGGGGGFGRGEKPTEFQQFVILSIDRATGKTLWQQTAVEVVPHEGHHRDHGFASHSPLTDGERLYGWFGSRGLYCYDLKGNRQWHQDFGDIRSANGFGEGNSIALSGDSLIVVWDHEGEDFITVLDKKTGKQRWKESRNERTTWVTPLVIEHSGKTQIIVPASGKVRSYDLATGKILWECGGLGSNVIPTPVVGHDMVFAMSGHQQPKLLAIRLGRTGDLTGTDAVAWSIDKSTPYVPSPLLVGDRLFILSRNSPRLSCFDAKSGQIHFEAQSLEGLDGVYASPVLTGERFYIAGRNGAVAVIKNSSSLEVLATNKLDEKFDASPAVVGKELFLRGHQHLYCLAEK